MFYSIIIPVFNRPDEIRELLESLSKQSEKNFEVLVVDDGSTIPCKDVVNTFTDSLDLKYFYKENTGQGFSRNYGFKKAAGDYFIVFDSDCLIPPHYIKTIDNFLNYNWLDAYGGPDRAHESFTPIQKAISYAMTSPFTTGGIRGNKRHADTFHPRSFNMGISREVFETTKGYRITRMGEDIEFSIRIIKNGFKTGLIPNAFVYHKRRTSLIQFFKQLHFFGRARINISRFYPSEIKIVHTLPLLFLASLIFILLTLLWNFSLFKMLLIPVALFFILIFFHATFKNKKFSIGLLSTAASFIQLTAYGIGFIREYLVKIKE
ncbi:MAG: glycosyltransferase [Balneolaceae bacterium]